MIRILKKLILIVSITNLYIQPGFSQDFGLLKSYTMNDFIGFDEVEGFEAQAGNISSVYLKKVNDDLLMRVTFDDMVERSNGKITDRFSEMDIDIEIAIGLNEENNLSAHIPMNNISNSGKEYAAMRTVDKNMLEVNFKGKASNLTDSKVVVLLHVILNGKIVDTFEKQGRGTRDGGNCAFIHHGNQGLTYTDVFYGNSNGNSGLDGSGFDEVLQVHEATGVPGNFHMSGTLMPAAEWHNPEFNDWLENLVDQGVVAMMTSALGQHIMPFMSNEMNDWSVYVETQMVDYRYGYFPKVAWVPERVWVSPGYYPDAGVIDWIGDNWANHGVEAVVLDDGPHLNGYDNRKIHWMNNGSGVNLRVIPINNNFVGNMHYNAQAAKDQIASMGQYNICVYGTDWEVAAEMNEHDGTFFLDNYENVLWYCHDNYPAISVWKLDEAINNPDFNGTGADITNGTYGLLGGGDGYGGSNNSWYQNWASTPSHSDQHNPQWDYGTVWWDAYNYLLSVNDNTLAQLGWYTLMINLHETGWHTDGEVADWEHRYSSHIKNANVYTEASRWADGLYEVTTACYYDDIDHDGSDELVMHNDKVFMVFEGVGGKANWVFYKDGLGNAYSVISSDMAYWSETEGDYNETGSNNHYAALSDVHPNQQNAIYNINIIQSFGDTVVAELDQWGVKKTVKLYTGVQFLDVFYDFYGQTGYVKSGWSPDLLDLIWSGKSHLQRIWGDYGSYCGYRNSSSGATAALVLGNGGAGHSTEFEGTLVKGDEFYGYDKVHVKLYAGYTTDPFGTSTDELNALASENMDVYPPVLYSPAVLVAENEVILTFSEALEQSGAENISNYSFGGFTGSYSILSAERQAEWNKVKLRITGTFIPGDEGEIIVNNVTDLYGNKIAISSTAYLTIPAGATPHTIYIDGTDDFLIDSELIEILDDSLYITWDESNLYLGFYAMDLNSEGDLFVNIDTDLTEGNGATSGSWGRVFFQDPYLPEYQVAIEGGGGSMQVNHYTETKGWNYPGNGVIGSSYEGWINNPFTEIAIPWNDLGNPDGFAVSVHISAEDTYQVPEIFPGVNITGNQPTITHWYGFFEPLLPGPMPLSGFQPADVKVVPNTPPEITEFLPEQLNLSMQSGENQLFEIQAFDQEDDELFTSWLLDGIQVGDGFTYLFQPDVSAVGNHTLEVIVSDMIPGNTEPSVTWNIEVTDAGNLQLSLQVLLEGPFVSTAMHTQLNQEEVIPLTQPYGDSPWYYSGTESVVSIPGIDVVDWVLIELRDATSVEMANEASSIARQAAFVQEDGSVIGINGSEFLSFNVSVSSSLFVVIWHRDHLPVLSYVALAETGGVYHYDFTLAATQAYGENQVDLGNNYYGMISADFNADGSVDENDLLIWEQTTGKRGYLPADANMDAEVNNQDKDDLWYLHDGDSQILPE